MRQASTVNTVKRTTVKTPINNTPITPSVATVAAPKSRVEIPSSKTTCSKEELQKKIAEKAYELYQKRNGGPGSPEQDWIQAEKIIKGK